MIDIVYRDSIRALVGLPTATERARKLEHEIKKLPQCEFPLENHFAPGIFVGAMLIRKGNVLTGAVHKTKHIVIVAKGRILIDCDGGAKEFAAGDIFESAPGVKRAGYALEDTVFINVHANPTNETDYPTLVEMLTESKFEDLLESKFTTLEFNKLKELSYV